VVVVGIVVYLFEESEREKVLQQLSVQADGCDEGLAPLQ
jgi:hypothetical protein